MSKHPHSHGPGCGHTAIEHDGHVDYLHDGHLCHQEGDNVEEHVIPISGTNPKGCRPFAERRGMMPSINMGLAAATRRFRTAITSTTWLTAGFTIPTATIATTTVPRESPRRQYNILNVPSHREIRIGRRALAPIFAP